MTEDRSKDLYQLSQLTEYNSESEEISDAKGEFERAFLKPGLKYSDKVDQPRYTSVMNFATALRAPSFDKLVRDLRSALVR